MQKKFIWDGMLENEQATAANVGAVLSMDQKAEQIRTRMTDIIQSASLDTLRANRPNDVEKAEKAISELDYRTPLSITLAGTEALNDQAETGVEFMTALQKGWARNLGSRR